MRVGKRMQKNVNIQKKREIESPGLFLTDTSFVRRVGTQESIVYVHYFHLQLKTIGIRTEY